MKDPKEIVKQQIQNGYTDIEGNFVLADDSEALTWVCDDDDCECRIEPLA